MKQKQSDVLDLGTLLRSYASKWYWFAISVVVCCSLGYLYSKTIQDKYEVRANIVLANDDSGSRLASGLSAMLPIGGSQNNAEDEALILRSHSVMREVAKELDLNKMRFVKLMPLKWARAYEEFPIDVYPDPSIDVDTFRFNVNFEIKLNNKGLASIKVKAKGDVVDKRKDVQLPTTVNTPFGKFSIATTKYYTPGKSVAEKITFTGYDNAAEILSKHIGVGLKAKRSNMIEIGMKTTDVEFTKRIINSLIRHYNDIGLREQNRKNTKTAQFIADRLVMIEDSLTLIENELLQFKQNQGVAELESDGKYQRTRMAEIEQQFNQVRIENITIRATLNSLTNSAADQYVIIPADIQGPIATTIADYNDLVNRRNRLARSARPGNETLAMLEDQILQSRKNIISSLQATLHQSTLREQELKTMLASANSDIALYPSKEREMGELMRQFTIKEQTLIHLLQKKEETAILLANATPKSQIIDSAFSLNDNVATSPKLILLMAFAFGLLIPVVYFWIRSILRNKFSTKEELQARTSIPVLGEVCADRTGQQLVVRPGGSSSTAELFRLIRVNLQFILGSGANNKVVLMTSTKSGEGKSFVSINLAASLSMLGKRTLLIGMDIRKPRLAQYLGLHPRYGLTEYLSADNISLSDIIIPDAILPGLDVIVAGPVPPNPSEMLASDRVDALFEQLRSRYDYVIIDSAPVGMVSDSFLLARVSDATIYVTRADYTTFEDINFAQEIYDEQRLRHLSIVVNGTATRKGYGYGYGEDNQKLHKSK